MMNAARPAQSIYLDWNATSPMHPDVVGIMVAAFSEVWGNSSSVHRIGRIARERIEAARASLAAYFQAHSRDVLFVSGGTEANNLALLDAPALVTSELEHPSVTQAARSLERLGRPVRWCPSTHSGLIEPAAVQRQLVGFAPGAVVAVQAANHETGVIQPLAAIAEVVHRARAWLHVDAVQAVGKMAPSDFLFGDSFSVAGHKIRGPKGIGALIWKCGRPRPQPLLYGGSQQRGFRPGTLDPALSVGLSRALELAHQALPGRARLGSLRDRLEQALSDVAQPNVAAVPRLPHVSSLFVPGWRGDELVAALDVEGLCVSSGSACSAGTADPSPVIQTMLGRERALGTLRISLGETTTEGEVEAACRLVRRVITRIAAESSRRPSQDPLR